MSGRQVLIGDDSRVRGGEERAQADADVWAVAASGSLPAKRAFDLGLGLLLLVLLLPLGILIAAAIAIDSGRPVLYRQDRVGARVRRGAGGPVWERRTFQLVKFRSMRAGVDSALHEEHVRAFVRGELDPADGKAGFKLAGDPRITRVGRLLRRTSLDELPQLLNVLAGQMSLVGPRPLPPYEVELFESRHEGRFRALPGMTGLWQVSGRAGVSFERMIELDLEYVRRRSLLFDLKILMMTVPAILRGRGAG